MASLVPSQAEIDSFPQKLTEGEKALIEVLFKTLDEDDRVSKNQGKGEWKIYVQPHLNGLRPDIVIFRENAGIGIFEVKDWNLDVHKVVGNRSDGYHWEVCSSDSREWVVHKDACPIKQAEKYKNCIFKYEIPILNAYKVLEKNIYSLIQPYVYFHKHTTAEVHQKLNSILDKHSNVFGYDHCKPEDIKRMLDKRYLRQGSNFQSVMEELGVENRLRNALAYPKHGDTNIKRILVPFNKKQENLLPNNPGSRRVLGAAGSGKTLVLVHKAVNAAREGKKVFLVCFNITMANLLRDYVTCLARHYGPHYHRNIEVGHFHRFFPYPEKNTEIDNRNMKEPVDVLLIDEGQDFERSWIERLQKVGSDNYHLMFCEDDRQNIYGKNVKDRGSVPGMKGRPNFLNQSYRIPKQTARLANALSTWAREEGELGTVESIKSTQGDLFVQNIWLNGTKKEALNAISNDVINIIQQSKNARADIAILVCTVEDGWEVCSVLDEINLPYQTNFESREQNQKLCKIYNKGSEKFKEELDELRRGYKAGFWMQGGKVKVCTIHSFKGWELSNILVFFNPNEDQDSVKISLLYTAITRSQESLAIYNINLPLDKFGEFAVQEGYVKPHSSSFRW